MRKIIYLAILNLLLCKPNLNYLENNINNQTNLISNHNQFLNSRKESTDRTNIILTLIVKYSWKMILPFIKSLISVNFGNYDIVIFVSEISQSVINHLKSFGVILYEIPYKLKSINQIYSYRWKLYSEFLEKNKDKYKLVLSVDIKDTIIQKEFFNLYENQNNFLGFSYEDADLNRLINKDWIIKTFGINIFKTINHKRTINAGTVWGSLNQFLEFSNILFKWLYKYPEAVDQSIVNYLIYHEKILNNSLIIFSDEYGPVITIGLNKRKNINLDLNNNILNYQGNIPSIVHQYDRHPDLRRMVKIKFCPELTDKKIIINFIIISQIKKCIIFL